MFADVPAQGYRSLGGSPPVTLFRGLPDVVTCLVIGWIILLVLTALEADTDGEIEVEATADGQGVTIFHTSAKTELIGLIALAAPFHIVGKSQGIDAKMVTRETSIVGIRGLRSVAEVAAHGEIAAVALPVAMARVAGELGVEPVGTDGPLFAQRYLQSDVGNQGCVVEQIGGYAEQFEISLLVGYLTNHLAPSCDRKEGKE